jgi:hypothetical protein
MMPFGDVEVCVLSVREGERVQRADQQPLGRGRSRGGSDSSEKERKGVVVW